MSNDISQEENNNKSTDDLWGDAMSEQKLAETEKNTSSYIENAMTQDLDMILDIPVKMTVELGRTKMTVKELLKLRQESVVALEGLAGEPLDILINGYLIAQGEVVVVSDKFGIRITDIITPSERMQRLSK